MLATIFPRPPLRLNFVRKWALHEGATERLTAPDNLTSRIVREPDSAVSARRAIRRIRCVGAESVRLDVC